MSSLDPLLVTALTVAPVNPDWVTSYGAVETWIWSIASKETGWASVWPPGVAASKPKGLLNIAPSKEKLLNWSFLPPKEPLLAVGSNLVKSAADLVIEGKVVNSLRPTLV